MTSQSPAARSRFMPSSSGSKRILKSFPRAEERSVWSVRSSEYSPILIIAGPAFWKTHQSAFGEKREKRDHCLHQCLRYRWLFVSGWRHLGDTPTSNKVQRSQLAMVDSDIQ